MKRTLIGGFAVLLIAGGILTIVTAAAIYRRSKPVRQAGTTGGGESFVGQRDWQKVPWIKEFTLTERSGREFHSKELDGKVWVVSFFFSACPSSCKQQNEYVRQLHTRWGPRDVTFVSITCDPATDTPQRLREYAHTFDAHPEHWLFLTGEMLHLRRVGAEVFNVSVDTAFHSDILTLVDKWGKVRGHFNWHEPTKIAELETSLERLLAETEPPAEEPSPPKASSPETTDATAGEAESGVRDGPEGEDSATADAPPGALDGVDAEKPSTVDARP